MPAPICGRRAPDFSGNAPSKIERFGRRLDPCNTQADLAFQEDEIKRAAPTHQGEQMPIESRHRRYYAENREKVSERQRLYYLANRDAILERQRKYYVENRERELERQRLFHLNNRQRILERKRAARDRDAVNSPISAEPVNEAEAACPPSFSAEALAPRFAERKI
jgi:hypothetical protein